MSTWRVFCAVELPGEVRARFEEHIARLRKSVPDAAASWSRVKNIHLTLKFFGNVELDRIPAISAAATRATEALSNFEIGVGNTGVFPRPSRPQVLWIGEPPREVPRGGALRIVRSSAGLLAGLPRPQPAAGEDPRGVPVYLIDPNGFVVMRYAPGSDPAGLRADLAKLLKLM